MLTRDAIVWLGSTDPAYAYATATPQLRALLARRLSVSPLNVPTAVFSNLSAAESRAERPAKR